MSTTTTNFEIPPFPEEGIIHLISRPFKDLEPRTKLAEWRDELIGMLAVGLMEHWVIDFSKTQFFDPAIVQALVAADKRLKMFDRKMYICGLCPEALFVFATTGRIDLFTISADYPAALQLIHRTPVPHLVDS